MTGERRTFAPLGALMMAPAAIGGAYASAQPVVESRGVIAVVPVRGALEHHRSDFFDSYECISERVTAALAHSPRAVVLSVSSPGGLMSGCAETACDIRARCAAAGVELVAYVDGEAHSAAYALAAVCSRIYAPPTATVGSIGVTMAIFDTTQADARAGVKITTITSGSRKADGNEHVPTSPEAVAAVQELVDEFAEHFFAHVVAGRPHLSVDALRALEAQTFTGTRAHSLGLVDGICTFDELIAALAAGTAPDAGAKGQTMTTSYDDALAALRTIAEGEDEEATKAKAALKAIDGEPDKGEDDDEEDEEPEKPCASSGESKTEALSSRLARLEAAQLDVALTARPDIDAKQAAVIRTLPLASALQMIAATPRRAAAGSAAASVTATGTRGEKQESPLGSTMGTDAQMAQAMGRLNVKRNGVTRTPSGAIFNVAIPVKAS